MSRRKCVAHSVPIRPLSPSLEAEQILWISSPSGRESPAPAPPTIRAHLFLYCVPALLPLPTISPVFIKSSAHNGTKCLIAPFWFVYWRRQSWVSLPLACQAARKHRAGLNCWEQTAAHCQCEARNAVVYSCVNDYGIASTPVWCVCGHVHTHTHTYVLYLYICPVYSQAFFFPCLYLIIFHFCFQTEGKKKTCLHN